MQDIDVCKPLRVSLTLICVYPGNCMRVVKACRFRLLFTLFLIQYTYKFLNCYTGTFLFQVDTDDATD